MYQLHRVRPLLVALPGDRHRQAARAAPAPARPARLPLRARGRGGREARRGHGERRRRRAAPRSARTSSASGHPRRRAVGVQRRAAPARRRARCMIEYVDKIVDMRRHLVQEEARFPAELTRTFKGMETQSNPWGVGAGEARRLGRRARHPDDRRQARRGVPLLRRLRRRVRRSQQEDHAGVREAAQEGGRRLRHPRQGGARATARPRAASATSTSTRRMAQMCVETLNGYNVKKIIVNCPHCFNTHQERVPAVRRQRTR